MYEEISNSTLMKVKGAIACGMGHLVIHPSKRSEFREYINYKKIRQSLSTFDTLEELDENDELFTKI